MSSADRLAPSERQEYLAQISKLSQLNVVPSRGFLDIYGFTEQGELVLAPDSFARGYQDSFLTGGQRPYLTFNLLGLIGQLSNRTWIFIPSYNRGLALGYERQNNLKFTILAEGERRLFQELQSQRQSQANLETQLRDALTKIKELQEQNEGGGNNR